MKGLKIYARRRWTSAARGGDEQKVRRGGTLFVHYSAFAAMSVNSWREQRAVMRAIHHHHTAINGWADLGYNAVIFQKRWPWRRARIVEGRGFGRVPAAQAGYNTGNLAVCVVLGPGEKVGRSTVRKLKSLYRRLPTTAVAGHRDVNATSCPGDDLYSKLPEIRKAK